MRADHIPNSSWPAQSGHDEFGIARKQQKNAPSPNLIPKVSKTEQIELDAGAILDGRVDLLFDEGGYPPSTRAYRPRRCPSPGLVFKPAYSSHEGVIPFLEPSSAHSRCRNLRSPGKGADRSYFWPSISRMKIGAR